VFVSYFLARNQFVTIPWYGAFLTQRTSSEIVEVKTHTFYPPTKVVSFNSQLRSNDGLLVNQGADSEQISYDEALKKIESQVSRWTAVLKEDETLTFNNIGDLWLSSKGTMQLNRT